MSSVSVFKSLQELFPQVDLRILRAISIEHEEDINEAIEFILSEVLPATTTPDLSCILHEIVDPEQELSKIHEGDYEPDHITIPDDKPVFPFGTSNCIGGAENQGLHSLVADGTKGFVLGQPHLFFSDADSGIEPEYDESIYNNSLSLNLNHLSEKEDDNLLYKAHNQSDHFEPLLDGGSKDILTEHLTKFSELECAVAALHVDTEELFPLKYEDNFAVQLGEQNISSTISDNCESPMEYGSKKENDINIQPTVCNDLSGCTSDGCRPLNLSDLETEVYTPLVLTCLLSSTDVSDKDQHYHDTTTETYKVAKDNENLNSFNLDVNYLEISSDENILPVSLATKSGYAVSTDVLEDSVMDAKNSKKSLLSSLESMVNMMQEVGLLEGKAKQAKEEALVAGHHFLCKVEELQQIVKKFKDENNMQSGQVYGERSILATEARELQSRLLRMSEERSKYLLVIEEIFRTLEVRKLAAKDIIVAADLEKREKEELALKALKEKELMRDAVVAESQKLEQEAEKNSKLREFLMDRSHAVDSLQGEIAIICEDILSLKQRVDGRNPLTKSLMSSSSTKSLMSSFSSSCGSSVHSADHNRGSPSSTIHLTKEETNEKHQKPENTTTNPLDDWEMM